MIQTYTNLMKRFADARPGLKLLAVEDAALPVSLLRTDVLVQQKKDLAATDEFLLRFVDAGVDSVDEVAGYLGLPRDLVLQAAVRQTGAGHVERTESDRFVLTQLGRAVTNDLVASQPTVKQISFVFDRLAWRPARYPQASLLRRSEAARAGMVLIPAASTATITAREVAIADLNQVLRGDRAVALRVNRIASRRHLWAPANLLVFGDAASRELELAVYIDDEIMQLHEEGLQSTYAVTRLGMTAAAAPFIPTPRYGFGVPDPEAEHEDVLSIEHLDHLLHASLRAERRLIVASPSARENMVTEPFVRYLRDRAKAGVSVTLLIGDASQVDEITTARLRKLASQNTEIRVGIVDLSGSAHLIYDDVHIESNFDWLAGGQTNREYVWNVGRLTRSEPAAAAAAELLLSNSNPWVSGDAKSIPAKR